MSPRNEFDVDLTNFDYDAKVAAMIEGDDQRKEPALPEELDAALIEYARLDGAEFRVRMESWRTSPVLGRLAPHLGPNRCRSADAVRAELGAEPAFVDEWRATPFEPQPANDAAGSGGPALTDEPPLCPQSGDRNHNSRQCVTCRIREKWVDRQADQALLIEAAGADETMRGDELFDLPPSVVLFGSGAQVISAQGQPWGIFGADGTGKSTDGEAYAKGRLGIVGWETLWGRPIAPLPNDRRVLYLALDRARQIFDGLIRGLDRTDAAAMAAMRRLLLKKSLPHNLASERGLTWMVELVHENRVGLVVIDSRKDVGGTLDAASIEGINALVRALSNEDVEVLILGHTREGVQGTPTIEDPSGYREVVSGLGSVVVLAGKPGVPEVEVHHVKPIHDLVPPFVIRRDFASGRATVVGPVQKPAPKPVQVTVVRSPMDGEPEVLKALKKLSDSATRDQLAKAMKVDPAQAYRYLTPMVQARVLRTTGHTTSLRYHRGPDALQNW